MRRRHASKGGCGRIARRGSDGAPWGSSWRVCYSWCARRSHRVGHFSEERMRHERGSEVLMRPEEAQIGKRVRISTGHRKSDFRGQEGIIAKRWGNPGYPAFDVLLDDGVWQLFWYHELEPLDENDLGVGRHNGATVGS
jgi:hypothetical protein